MSGADWAAASELVASTTIEATSSETTQETPGMGARCYRRHARAAIADSWDVSKRDRETAQALAGMRLIARSASAVIVSEGFTPGFALTAEPSMT